MIQTSEKKFKRAFDEKQQEKLCETPLYKDHILKDINEGIIFPAFRNNTIDFYHKGGKVFRFDDGRFSTHIKYASVLQGHSNPYINDEEIKKAELIKDFIGGYTRIKENCSLYSGVESAGIARLCAPSNYVKSTEDIIVLDIEVSLHAIEDNLDNHLSENKKRSQDRIDILLFNKKTQILQFVEAKHFSNKELWAQENTKPKVVEQIKRYERQISAKHDQIISAYTDYFKFARRLFNLDEPFPYPINDPIKLNREVILLVFGFDNDQKKKIEKLLKEDGSLDGILARFMGNPKSASDVWK